MSRKRFNNARHGAIPPTIRSEDGPIGGTVETHPAYGQITVHKTSGMTALYGSDFLHQQYVSIEIHESELHRSLNRDWPYSKTPIIRLSMSEAQWGHFVSSFSDGTGTQCTIERRQTSDGYVGIPGVLHRDEKEVFKSEAKEAMREAESALDDLIRELTEGDLAGLSKAKQDRVLTKIRDARSKVGPHMRYLADQIDEHVEERIEKAKTEIDAWMQNQVMRKGMEAIAAEQGLPLITDQSDAA